MSTITWTSTARTTTWASGGCWNEAWWSSMCFTWSVTVATAPVTLRWVSSVGSVTDHTPPMRQSNSQRNSNATAPSRWAMSLTWATSTTTYVSIYCMHSLSIQLYTNIWWRLWKFHVLRTVILMHCCSLFAQFNILGKIYNKKCDRLNIMPQKHICYAWFVYYIPATQCIVLFEIQRRRSSAQGNVYILINTTLSAEMWFEMISSSKREIPTNRLSS